MSGGSFNYMYSKIRDTYKGELHDQELEDRPQSKYDFLEILAHYVPDEICTYPEYRGKPYYSIHFRENGEDYAGFGTYNPEVLSRYLREYFFAYPGGGQADGKGGSET